MDDLADLIDRPALEAAGLRAYADPEEMWASDALAELAGLASRGVDTTALEVLPGPLQIESLLGGPAHLVITEFSSERLEDDRVCIVESGECLVPADGWPTYPLSEAIWVRADSASTADAVVASLQGPASELQAAGIALLDSGEELTP